MSEIRTRIAPSPTGIPHIGTIRTALFNYFFAKVNKGKFILRIEDTDQVRKVEGAVEAIKDSLSWIGIKWDEYVTQSERLETYKKYVEQLLEKGLAKKEDEAVRLITPKEGETHWIDGVGSKKISIENKIIEDFVILKSDGYPTYHLANVVDDHLMQITHVIRGEDWISSTPKHIMLYQAFGWNLPVFVHVPNVMGADNKKLSKRFGAKSVLDFKQDGYLPEALVNYLALLGWSPKNDQEILSVEEIISQFSLEKINSSPAVFDNTKLSWMNGEYIRKMSDEKLTERLAEFFKGVIDDTEKIKALAPLVKDRIKTLRDFELLTDFVFERAEYDIKVFGKINIENQLAVLRKILEAMEKMDKPWNAEKFEQTFRALSSELTVPARELFQLIRVAVSGKLVTPPLFESIQILGEEESIKRVQQAINLLS